MSHVGIGYPCTSLNDQTVVPLAVTVVPLTRDSYAACPVETGSLRKREKAARSRVDEANHSAPTAAEALFTVAV